MKQFRWILLILIFLPLIHLVAGTIQIVEIPIKGLTCQFCAYGAEKELKKLPNVSTVSISFVSAKARIIMKPDNKADVSAIRGAIQKAGYTPGQAVVRIVKK